MFSGFSLGTLTSSHCPKNMHVRLSGNPFFLSSHVVLHQTGDSFIGPLTLRQQTLHRYNEWITWISGLTQSSDYQRLHTQSKGLQVWLYGPKGRSQNKLKIANKHISLLSDHRHQPEQHDVSRRAPARWNERAHDGQGHVELKDVVAVVLPGTLTQRGGHVHARRHHLLDAGAVMKRLTRKKW